jgi:hypothetical protein
MRDSLHEDNREQRFHGQCWTSKESAKKQKQLRGEIV